MMMMMIMMMMKAVKHRYKKEKQLMTEENVKLIKKKDGTCHLSEVSNDEIYDKLKLDIL